MINEIYRVQLSGSKWILRHPERVQPLLQHEDKDEIIKQLPEHFKKSKEPVTVKIMDDFGRVMNEKVYAGEV